MRCVNHQTFMTLHAGSERSQQLYVERTVNLANALVEHGVKL